MSPRLHTLLMTTTALLALAPRPSVAGGPDGGVVVGGTATISGAGSSNVTINQTSDRAIINWNTFNLGAGDSTRFVQPGTSSVALNRVTGGLGASTIDGTISANGRVFLINPDGMLFGPNSVVNTAGFVATTHDIKNDDFMAGRYNFNISGRPDASIVNQGHITATSGGFAALVAPGVRNTGTITATLGTVSLASGNMFTLDLYGDRLIQLGVGDEIAAQVRDVATGQPLKSLVSNEGKLRANGGRVELTAAAARAVVDSVINNKGVIEANSIGTRKGMIVLGAATGASKPKGAPKQTIKIAGKVSAAGKKKGTSGGKIVVTGENIEVASAKIDASGRAGGGTILIGGDWAGGNPTLGLFNNQSAKLETGIIPTATTVSVDGASTINASARDTGDGGKVILWSDNLTTFAGAVFARGGETSGNGGFVEVSGHDQLAFTGNVNTLAPNGANGTLLLDPRNVQISSGADSNTPNSGGTFTPTDSPSNLNVTTLRSALQGGNVVVTTGGAGSPGTDAGDIEFAIATNLSWDAATTLTLSAFHNITLLQGSQITNTGAGNLIMRADNSGIGTGTVNLGGGFGSVDFRGSSGTVSIYYDPTPINGDHKKYENPIDFTGAVSVVDASHLNAYMLVNNSVDLQLVGFNTITLAGTYALGKDIVLNPLTNFNPLGAFTGTLDGNGGLGTNYAISNLTIASSGPAIGLFTTNSGTIRNVTLANVSVTNTGDGIQSVGALVGQNSGLITNSSVNGQVSGPGFAGGLVGLNLANGVITNSFASGTVFATGDAAGGLAGANAGTISGSHANSVVTGTGLLDIGGLVGFNNGGIDTSFANGSVFGTTTTAVGGLVGLNSGTVTTSFAANSVDGTGTSWVGGLIGASSGTVTDSYAVGPVGTVATTGDIGGLIGFVSDGSVQNSYSTGLVSGAPGASLGGLVAFNTSTVTNSVWDTQTSGQPTSAGGTGLTTAALQAGLQAGWSTAVWGIVPGVSYPFLKWQFPVGTPQVVSGIAFNDRGATPVVGGKVGGLLDGHTLMSTLTGDAVATGANGYYYFLLAPGTLASPHQLGVATLTAVPGQVPGGTFQQDAVGSVTGLDIYGGYLRDISSAGSLSSVAAARAVAIGANPLVQAAVDALPNREIDAKGSSFVIDQPINTGTLVLVASGAVTQTATIAGTNLLLLGNGGSYTLTNAGNHFSTLGGDTGSINLSNNADLSLAGINATTLQLAVSGAVTQTAPINVTALGLANLGSGATYTLTNPGNHVSTLAGLANGITLTDAANLNIGVVGGLTGIATGTLVISDTGTVTQTAPITATNLALLGAGGSFTLTNAANQIGTLAANTGSANLTDTGGLVIGTVGSTHGVTVATTLTLTNDGKVTQSDAITAPELALLGAGGNFALDNAANQIGKLAANTGSVSLTDTGGLVIGTVGSTHGVTVATTLTLTNNGLVTQTDAITAPELALLGAGGSFTLTNASNDIGTLAANTGIVVLSDIGGMSIGTVGGTIGITATTVGIADTGAVTQTAPIVASNLGLLGISYILNNPGNQIGMLAGNVGPAGTISLTNNGNLAIGTVVGNVGVTAGTFAISDNGAVTQAAPIAATNLALLGAGGSYALTNPGNSIGTLAANTGSVSLTDTGGLIIGTVGSIHGVNVTSLTLTNNGAVTQTDAITAAELALLGAGGSYTLTNAANQIGTLAANTGIVSLTDTGGLAIGTVGSTHGVTVTSLTLTNDGLVTQSDAITATELALLGAGGNYTLTNPANHVGTLAANTGAINFVDAQGMTIGTVAGTSGVTTTGAFTLNASGTIAVPAAVGVGTVFTLAGGSWVQNNAALPAFSANDFRIAGGSFLRVTGGTGAAATPYSIADIYGLQGIGSTGLLGNSYVLSNDINATSATAWNAGAGFKTLGGTFTGSFDGQNHTIDHLTIASNASTAGLFGTIGTGASVSNLKLTNVTVIGSGDAIALGGLAGENDGAVSNVSVTGAVSVGGDGSSAGGLVGVNAAGGSIVNSTMTGTVARLAGIPASDLLVLGGLAGQNSGSISSSAAAVTVTGGFSSSGGLVGQNFGSVASSSASGVVNGFGTAVDDIATVGGLVGSNLHTASIANSSFSGNVTGADGTRAGGLVGFNDSDAKITQSHASGNVHIDNPGLTHGAAGGLVGFNLGAVTLSDASGNVSGGKLTSVGGLVGFSSGSIADSHATGNVTGTDAFAVGGLVGSLDGTVSNSSASGAVTGSGSAVVTGGLVGTNLGTITNSSASGAVSNGLAVGGLVGLNAGTISNSSSSSAVSTTNSGPDDFSGGAGGLVGLNLAGTITNSHATGAVTGGAGAYAGGLVGANFSGPITNSDASGDVSGGAGSILGGFVAFNLSDSSGASQTITGSHASGSITGGANTIAGGFFGVNLFGAIDNSFATGAVSSGKDSTIGGFGGLNIGTVDVAYASGAVSGGDKSFVGGFLGVNYAVADANVTGPTGVVTQSYALGATTGGADSFVAGFAAINVGSLDQTYAGGLVTGGAGSTTGGLVAANAAGSYTLPPGIALLDPPGTATNSYWDRQTTGQNTSAGGQAVDTPQLAPGLPTGFDPSIWGTSPGQYPYLVAFGPSDNTPGQAVLPPLSQGISPLVQQIQDLQPPAITLTAVTTGEVVNTQAVTQALQQPQGQSGPTGPAGGTGPGAGGLTPPAPEPIRLNVGEGRYFYLPPPGETRLVQNEVVLQLPCNPGDAFDTVVRQLRITVINSQCLGGQTAVYRVQVSSGQNMDSTIRALAAYRIIAAAQANYTYALAQGAEKESEGDAGQYVLEKLKLADVHRQVKGANVSIGVIDSEIDVAHPDLEGIIADRFDATGDEDKPHPHGTGMAGAIGSHHRLMGIAPSARLYAIRAFSAKASNAESTTFNILKGLDWAVNNGVRIVNMSFAGPKDPSLERALKTAHDKGIVLVAAAGNAGPKSPPLYPAADPSVIAVTATDIDDKLFAGANRGRYVAIAAPGVDILVPAPDGAYQMTTGTSVATAHISGIVALLLERNPRLKPDDIRKILAASAKRLGPNNEFGAGLVDPVKALELAAPRSAAAPAPITR